MIPIYAIVSFLSYLYYHKAVYFEVLRDCYEAFAIASFFTLMCHYIAPNLHEQKDYFRSVQPKNWVWPVTWMQKCTGGEDKGWLRRPRSGLTWFNVGIPSAEERPVLKATRLSGSASSNTASSVRSSLSLPSSPNISVVTARARKIHGSHIFGLRGLKPSPSRSPCTV
jgi:hypothetical protein